MEPLNPENFHQYLQNYITNTVIGISALRNQYSGNGGVKKVREFAYQLNLDDFFAALQGDYSSYLDSRTEELVNVTDLKFGSVRKVLNIYFRSIAYSGYFQQKYLRGQDLISHESILNKLEIPVDSYVGKGLRAAFNQSSYKWEGVIHIDAQKNAEYQVMAEDLAKERGIARCHLDLEFYSKSKL